MKAGTLRRELNNPLSSSSTGKWHLLFLLGVLGSQLCLSRCQASTSASGENCTPECGIGYRCRVVNGEPRCEERTCNRNCTGKPEAQVCGTNGVTYRNRCELKKARCQLAMEINVTYSGPCITLPPPPEHLCRALQRDIDNADVMEYQRKCNYMELLAKGRDGTLTLIDLLPCYRPQCTNDAFAARQCSVNVDGWCWCSTADGRAIEGTLQYNLPAGTCDRRRSCEYQGRTHKDGDLFTSQDGCGFCECLDGRVSCFEDYVPDSSGRLNASQLNLLREEIMQVFYFQYNHDEHVVINIRHIHQHPTTVPDLLRERILSWKFHHYDRNGDNVLFPAEEFIFQLELYEFVRCKAFFDHVSDLVDDDNDGLITYREWTNFFNDDDISSSTTSGLGSSSSSGSVTSAGSQPSKRSVSPVLRKPLERRNKFFYVLF